MKIEIEGLGTRKLVRLNVNDDVYYEDSVDKVHYPSPEKPFWQIELTDGTTINATGNVTLCFHTQ